MVGETIEQRGRHLRIAEDAWPFAEGEIGRNDDRRALIEPADEMEQELAAGLGEGQITKFIENDEVETGQIIGEPSLASGACLSLEAIDQIDGGEEASARAGANATAGDSDREMRFARSSSADVIGMFRRHVSVCRGAEKTRPSSCGRGARSTMRGD